MPTPKKPIKGYASEISFENPNKLERYAREIKSVLGSKALLFTVEVRCVEISEIALMITQKHNK